MVRLFQPPPLSGPVDSEMAVAADPRKRLLSDSSSEVSIGEFSSDPAVLPPAPNPKPGSKSKPGSGLPLASKSTSGSSVTDSVLALSSKSKGANKKSAKKSMGHLPAGLASASQMFTRSKH